MKRPFAYFAGTGHAVPKQIVTNADIAAMGLETNDQWIIERTGIKQRHIAKDGESLTSLSADAARQAMARAGVQPGEIDTIVLGTASPDHLLPATAVEVQTMLGCTRAAAFDIGAACSGFLYGAIVGESLIASGSADTVLVIGAEKLSAIVDWTDPLCRRRGRGRATAHARWAEGHSVVVHALRWGVGRTAVASRRRRCRAVLG